jgi:hypothetical protein
MKQQENDKSAAYYEIKSVLAQLICVFAMKCQISIVTLHM